MNRERIETKIADCVIDLMPVFGDGTSGVMHILPDGTNNSDWFSEKPIHDVYACFSTQKNELRGGHIHPILEEMFVTVSGTALWIVSDFRKDSKTFGCTDAIILGIDSLKETQEFSNYTKETTGKLARITVPAGVYHAILPLAPNGFTAIALGTTPYNKTDYLYPTLDEVPSMKKIIEKANACCF